MRLAWLGTQERDGRQFFLGADGRLYSGRGGSKVLHPQADAAGMWNSHFLPAMRDGARTVAEADRELTES